jgi:hypothetical protein
MIDYGTYTFLYTPPSGPGLGSVEPTLTMTLSSDASLDDMLRVFAQFLRGAGYSLSSSSTLEVIDIADPFEI